MSKTELEDKENSRQKESSIKAFLPVIDKPIKSQVKSQPSKKRKASQITKASKTATPEAKSKPGAAKTRKLSDFFGKK